MPIELTGAHPPEYRLKVGDVIMVRRRIKKKGEEPFWWRHFGVVTKVTKSVGRVFFYQVLDDKPDRKPIALLVGPESKEATVWYLPEAEWPDGVHALRTKLILEGRLDEVI